MANPNDCHKFYICIKQKPYEYNCDPQYHFDSETRQCMPGSECGSDSGKPSACSSGSVRPVDTDCFIFEACVNGQYQKLNCPPNYYFNARQKHCVPFEYNAEFQCNCLMPEHTVLENKNNCETYYVCRDKSADLENCPLGQYYNKELNTCIIDLEGICLMKPTIPPSLELDNNNLYLTNKVKTTPANEAIQKECQLLNQQGKHFETFPKECNSFYICVNGQLYTQYCPHGFYYEKEKKYCVIDSLQQCLDTEDLALAKLESV